MEYAGDEKKKWEKSNISQKHQRNYDNEYRFTTTLLQELLDDLHEEFYKPPRGALVFDFMRLLFWYF